MNRIAVVPFAAAALAAAVPAFATPSSTFWAPSTPYVQPYGVLHVTYDTYFGGESQYPTTSGLEIGVLSGKGLQAEVGFDLLYPTYAGGEPLDFPVLFNAKLGGPEGALFDGAPAWSAGIYGVGLEADVTDYDALHLMLGKTTGIGFLAAGGYYGLNETLFRSSAGEANQAGAMASWTSNALACHGVDHLNLCWDVQTGENVVGATGGGVSVWFTPMVDLILGPVFFFDEALQPGGSSWMWSLQFDADIPF